MIGDAMFHVIKLFLYCFAGVCMFSTRYARKGGEIRSELECHVSDDNNRD